MEQLLYKYLQEKDLASVAAVLVIGIAVVYLLYKYEKLAHVIRKQIKESNSLHKTLLKLLESLDKENKRIRSK